MSGATLDRPARRTLGVGAAIVLVLVAAAASVLIGIVRGAGAPDTAGEQVSVATESGGPALPAVYVHVFGAVGHPGLYRLEDGARVVDVIAAAGGLSADAEESAVNLARRVTDGEQLRIPVAGEAPPATGAPGVASDGRVNLNTADAAALDTLPRVGPAIAERIIRWREENGSFTSVDDLLSVPGIGDKMLASLRDLVTV
ncbi:helix-hairpin-helix domain-containing protein [Microbacterium flavum]|uniref:Helix-hairpin-helix domain-containing protein n=1 Tax=Microbacterium flavum TaxID=415216 RepID=A0ABS5XWF8_9MICO|nr:ComEA family DNA-binding protein [Microbacterium flavum]MBT8798504.1 helix-hairpin-helix domain-containing protein [Microbacterium flavum]